MNLILPVKDPVRIIVEVWDPPTEEWNFKEPFGGEFYDEINDWCWATFGYRTRLTYNSFEFKNQQDLTVFLLRWS